MEFDLDLNYEIGIQLAISFLIGMVIGIEREYHSKAAGLRTMIMICLGSTIFTLISLSIEDVSPSRIASNIITGIGFLGAGVIFKDGLTISGITTATTIWICAALGMAVGAGEYFIAFSGTITVLIVLVLLQPITLKIEQFHQARTYTITCMNTDGFIPTLEIELKKLNLKSQKRKDFKQDKSSVILYEVYGKEKNLNELNRFLKQDNSVQAYIY